jgi:hypothetical protein
MSKASLGSLLTAIAQLPEFFGESIGFGSRLVDCSVTQCLADAAHLAAAAAVAAASTHAAPVSAAAPTNAVAAAAGVSEESFNRWLLREPQIIVWLPTHFRLISSKGIRHGTKCSKCKMDDIIGMRYDRV